MKLSSLSAFALSLAPGLLALGGCQTAPTLGHEVYRAEWVPLELPQLVTTASPGKKVFITLQDFEAQRQLKRIKSGFEEQLTKAHGLELAADRAEADFVVHLVVRFFNESPAADNARALRLRLEDADVKPICGGFPDWLDESCGAITIPHARPIVLQFDEGSSNRSGTYREWNLLIDVAVGERGACATEPNQHVRRVGRLLGFASGPNMTRDQALEVFLTGKRPQPEPKKGEAASGQPGEAAIVEASDNTREDNDSSVVDVLCSSGFLLLP